MRFYRKGEKIVNLDNVQYIEVVHGFNILNFYFDGGKKYPVDYKDTAERESAIKQIMEG